MRLFFTAKMRMEGLCVDSTRCWYDYIFHYGVLFAGAMEVYVVESMPLGSGAIETFHVGSLLLGILPFTFLVKETYNFSYLGVIIG